MSNFKNVINGLRIIQKYKLEDDTISGVEAIGNTIVVIVPNKHQEDFDIGDQAELFDLCWEWDNGLGTTGCWIYQT